MSNLVKLMILYGGKSGEHEISLISAASVLQNLDPQKYDILPIAIDKKGQFHRHNYIDLISHKDKLPVTSSSSKKIDSIFINGKCAFDVDVVFPMVHGPLYEDGALQGLLRLSDVAFVGSDVMASAIGMDKDISRRLACNDAISCARYRTLSVFSSNEEKNNFREGILKDFSFPIFVKPCSLGSSVGIQKVVNEMDLMPAIEDAFRYDETVIVEEFISGREVELAVLESDDSSKPKVSTAGEIKVNTHPDGFYSYAAKYLDKTGAELIIPASLKNNTLLALQEAAAHIFQALKCRGMARVDFFVDDKTNTFYFNEINTIPGFTSISMYPKLWQETGLSYKELLDNLINLALKHFEHRKNIVTDYL